MANLIEATYKFKPATNLKVISDMNFKIFRYVELDCGVFKMRGFIFQRNFSWSLQEALLKGKCIKVW